MRCLFVTETARREQSRHLLFNYLYQSFSKRDIDFSILSFNEASDEPILSDSGLHAPVKSIAIDLYKRASILKFWRALCNHHPDHLLIGGYGYIENWLALTYSIVKNIPVTFWTGAGNETTVNHSYIRSFLKKIFITQVDTAITYGTNATKYLIELGMDPSKINKAVNVSNVDFFRKTLSNYFDSDEMKLQVKDLPKPILVFAGRLEVNKGVNLLIEQLKIIPHDRYFCYFIGSGSLDKQIQKSIENKEINAKLFGFLDQSQIARRLVESDVYILPSLNDPFSRTLSEALAAGCFVLNSKYDDASYDLIDEGNNGQIFNPIDFDEFKNCMEKITSKRWSRPCRNKITKSLKYNMIDYAGNIIDSVNKSLQK